MRYLYWTKTPGIGGGLEKPEDFVVKEILNPKYFARYKAQGNRKVSKLAGKYGLFLLRKRDMTTHEALRVIARRFKAGKIGFAGLKDKFAVTEQYITAANGFDFKETSMELIKVGTTDRFISKGDLVGNEFEITLHGCRNTENLRKATAEIWQKSIPNYFGPQRFGKYGNNNVIGRLLVKRSFSKALKMINKLYGKGYKDVRYVDKNRLKFFVNAYQSWIFNELLNEYVKNGRYFSGYLPLVGYKTGRAGKAKAVMKKEGIKAADFMIDDLRLACSGGKRKAFIKTKIDCRILGDKVVLKLFLPSGSYATVVLREVCKGA